MFPYPEYKDSNIEWLGKVPTHWKTHSIKRAIDRCINGIWGSEADGLNDITVLRVADFDRNKLEISDKKLTLRSVSLEERESRQLKQGDLVIEKSGGGEKTPVGCVVLFNKTFPAVTSNFVAKMTPKKGFNSRYLNYCFAHLYSTNINHRSIKQTTGIQNIDAADYLSNYFVFPNELEQEEISNFLDRNTAHIDRIVKEKRIFIELLTTKRHSLISHTVTKGLNPVVMKDSGIPWIGEVPKHWAVRKIKHNVKNIEQGWSPQCESTPVTDGKSWAVVKVGCVNRGVFNPLQNKKLPSTLEPKPEYSINKGDLLISRANAKEWVGSAAVAQEDFPYLILCDKIYRLALDPKKADPNFIAYYLGSDKAREQIEIAATGTSSSMLNIGQGTILNMPIAIPDIAEQREIVSELRVKTEQLELLIQEVQKSVELLKEQRIATISAAVTGKIDVRDQ